MINFVVIIIDCILGRVFIYYVYVKIIFIWGWSYYVRVFCFEFIILDLCSDWWLWFSFCKLRVWLFWFFMWFIEFDFLRCFFFKYGCMLYRWLLYILLWFRILLRYIWLGVLLILGYLIDFRFFYYLIFNVFDFC